MNELLEIPIEEKVTASAIFKAKTLKRKEFDYRNIDFDLFLTQDQIMDLISDPVFLSTYVDRGMNSFPRLCVLEFAGVNIYDHDNYAEIKADEIISGLSVVDVERIEFDSVVCVTFSDGKYIKIRSVHCRNLAHAKELAWLAKRDNIISVLNANNAVKNIKPIEVTEAALQDYKQFQEEILSACGINENMLGNEPKNTSGHAIELRQKEAATNFKNLLENSKRE